MSPPPCLCSLSVRMAVKCGICGVLDAEVSFDSFVVVVYPLISAIWERSDPPATHPQG